MNCIEQETCPDFFAGHKRKVHHVRITERCILFDTTDCPMMGNNCNIEKIRRLSEKVNKLKEVSLPYMSKYDNLKE